MIPGIVGDAVMPPETPSESADAEGHPTFDEEDRSIFSIKDKRLRADTMREMIVPKLREIASAAISMIEAVYGIDPLSTSVESLTPEHCPDAAKTRVFETASAGLVMRQANKKHYYIKLLFNLSASGLFPAIEGSRPVESEALFGVLRDYRGEILQTIDNFQINIFTKDTLGPGRSNEEVIDSTRIDRGEQWWASGLLGSLAEYPIESDEHINILIDQFVAMFPIYQAACERLSGIDDRFRDYFQLHLDAIAGLDDSENEEADEDEDRGGEHEDAGDSLNPEASALEGADYLAPVKVS
jgi:hypothetical protein